MKIILEALSLQFAELRQHVRVDADMKAAAFAVSLEQAIAAAGEGTTAAPVPAELDRLDRLESNLAKIMEALGVAPAAAS